MGLGKTIQVLALLLVEQDAGSAKPAGRAGLSAGQLGGRNREIRPGLTAAIVHPSAMAAERSSSSRRDDVRPGDHQLRLAAALPALAATAWRLVILDEAQAIKNPAAQQTKAVKALKAKARIALTGTPVENHLGDLWSIFDFVNPRPAGRRQAVFAAMPRAWPTGPTIPTGRCGNWCGPTSCAE